MRGRLGTKFGRQKKLLLDLTVRSSRGTLPALQKLGLIFFVHLQTQIFPKNCPLWGVTFCCMSEKLILVDQLLSKTVNCCP